MKCFIVLALMLVMSGFALVFQSPVQAQHSAHVAEGALAGHVWLDSDCDGLKDVQEGNIANAGIVQLVNTGSDHTLTPGDRATTMHTDASGNWTATGVRQRDFDDVPIVWAIAVGEGTAAGLGYTVSPNGGDSILTGPTHASATFQVEAGVTKQMGEIGLCPLSASQGFTIYLPALQH